MNFILVNSDLLLTKLSELSDTIWHEFFPSILSSDQIDYMVEKFQSYDAMKKQIENGYNYYLLKLDDQFIGYTCVNKEKEKLFISKIYLLKEWRGKHLINNVFKFFDEICVKYSLKEQYMTVNKYNSHAINVYKHFGFVVTDDIVTDIGHGYVMDDYIMKK